MVRKCKGRRKVEMVKISNANSLMVTFSKRRSGIFKKASELTTLCGAEVGIIVFSPGQKAFSFGHPSVENVVDRYLYGLPQNSNALQLFNAHLNVINCDLNLQLTKVQNQLEMEKKRSQDLDRLHRDSQRQCWWTLPIEELSLEQLEQLKVASLRLRQDVTYQTDQLIIQGALEARLQTFAPDPYAPAPPLAFAPDPYPFDHTGSFDNNIVPFGYNYGYGTGGFF